MEFRLLRRYFLAGLAVLLPVIITIAILSYLFRLIYHPLAPIVDKWVAGILHVHVPGIGFAVSLILALGIVIVVGLIASTVIGKRVLLWWDKLLAQLPIVRIVYPPARQIVQFLMQPRAQRFGRTVLIQFPRKGCYMIGFLTGHSARIIENAIGRQRMVHVFVPNTPTPLTGFLAIVPEEDVIHLDLSVEDALKMVVSGGVFQPGAHGMEIVDLAKLPDVDAVTVVEGDEVKADEVKAGEVKT